MTLVSANVIYLSGEKFTGQILFKQSVPPRRFLGSLVYPAPVECSVSEGVMESVEILPGEYEVQLLKGFRAHTLGTVQVSGDAVALSEALEIEGAEVTYEGDGVYLVDGAVHVGDGAYKVGKGF